MYSSNQQVVSFLFHWFEENVRDFPWRMSDDPYVILVAEFLLQKTPADRVKAIFNKLISKYPDITSLAKADPSELSKEFAELGLTKRFKWIVDSMNFILSKHNGKIPTDKKKLLELPGVGEYTASAFLSFGHNVDIEIVDANVIRFYTRFFNIPKIEVNELAREMVPKRNSKNFNFALLDFASLVCKKKPVCSECGLSTNCSYFNSNLN